MYGVIFENHLPVRDSQFRNLWTLCIGVWFLFLPVVRSVVDSDGGDVGVDEQFWRNYRRQTGTSE